MKKFLIRFFLIILVIGAGWFAWHFYWVFGEGVKAGQLNNFNKKGYIFKTYEGKLIQVGFQGGAPGSVQSNEFRFSVASESVASQLMSNSGKEFELHYKEYMGALPWRGTSVFIVDSVLSMHDAKTLPSPYTP
ncbi:MAG TPA: hypothetical protein DIC22_08740 [Chitinophagaceae bacterium]|jgi:hypothetical protein|nr:hypothetical protein [Chitinophagaceae bacterium]